MLDFCNANLFKATYQQATFPARHLHMLLFFFVGKMSDQNKQLRVSSAIKYIMRILHHPRGSHSTHSQPLLPTKFV